jgi:hypothetical protein
VITHWKNFDKIIVFGRGRHVKVEEKDISNGDYKIHPNPKTKD